MTGAPVAGVVGQVGCLPDIEPGRCDPHALAEVVAAFPWSIADEVVADALECAGLEADIILMSDADLTDAIERECARAARLYTTGVDTTRVDARVDLLFGEFDRREVSR